MRLKSNSKNLFYPWIYGLGALLVCVSSLYGEEPLQDPVTYSYAKEFFHMLLSLGILLIVVFAAVWLLKKVMRSRLQMFNQANQIKVLERRPFNQKTSLYLIEVCGKTLLISDSPTGIRLVADCTREGSSQDPHSETPQESASPSFLELLKKKFKKPPAGSS